MRKILPTGAYQFMARVNNQGDLNLLTSAADHLAIETGRDPTNAALLNALLRTYLASGDGPHPAFSDILNARPRT